MFQTMCFKHMNCLFEITFQLCFRQCGFQGQDWCLGPIVGQGSTPVELTEILYFGKKTSIIVLLSRFFSHRESNRDPRSHVTCTEPLTRCGAWPIYMTWVGELRNATRAR